MTTVRIRYKKMAEASYISLLDMQRVYQRVLKRSGLPIWYTLGFNPHIYMTFSCPLSLGQESLCESVDVKTEAENADYAAWKEALNAIMPAGIEVYAVYPADKKADDIEQALYTVSYPAAYAQSILKYNDTAEAVVEKKTKRSVKQLDLKQFCPAVQLAAEGETVSFSLQLPASAELTVNPALFTSFLEQSFDVPSAEAAILRKRLIMKDGTDF